MSAVRDEGIRGIKNLLSCFCFAGITIVVSTIYTVRDTSNEKPLNEAGLLDLTMKTEPIELMMNANGFNSTGGIITSVDGAVAIKKREEIRGICLMVRAVDIGKLKISFRHFINQAEV